MKHYLGIVMACCVVLSLALTGCGEKKGEAPEEAAAPKAEAGAPVLQKVKDLVNQAKAHYDAQRYAEAINKCRQALQLDKNSSAAKDLFEKSKDKLVAIAKEAKEKSESAAKEAQEKSEASAQDVKERSEEAEESSESAVEQAKEKLGGFLKKTE